MNYYYQHSHLTVEQYWFYTIFSFSLLRTYTTENVEYYIYLLVKNDFYKYIYSEQPVEILILIDINKKY